MKSMIALAVGALLLGGCAEKAEQLADKAAESAAKVEEAAKTTAEKVGDTAGSAAGQLKDVADAAGDMAQDAANAVGDKASELAASAAAAGLTVGEGQKLIGGTTGCGHCDFSTGTSCNAAVKAHDGTVYIVDGLDDGHQLNQHDKGGKAVMMVGVPYEKDGEQHVKLVQYKM